MPNAINAVRDGYLKAVDWIDDHPHATLWLAAAALITCLLV